MIRMMAASMSPLHSSISLSSDETNPCDTFIDLKDEIRATSKLSPMMSLLPSSNSESESLSSISFLDLSLRMAGIMDNNDSAAAADSETIRESASGHPMFLRIMNIGTDTAMGIM